MSNQEKLITISKCGNEAQAEFIRRVLENAGIEAKVSGVHQAGLTGLNMIPVEVLIFESDKKAAEQAIREAEDDDQEQDDSTPSST